MIHTDGKRTCADNTLRAELDTAESVQADAEAQPRSWQERAEAADPQCGDQRFRYLLETLRPEAGAQWQRAYFNDLPDALRARDYCRAAGCESHVNDRDSGTDVTWPDVCRCSWTEERCPFRAGDVAGCSAAQGLD
jgi:hypothetical protein